MTGSAFVSYLGPNTVAIARELGERLTDELGIDLAFAPAASWAEIETAIEAGAPRLFWLCGLVTVVRIDAGRLDAEIVAAPVFPDEPGPVYRSVVVARGDAPLDTLNDLTGARLAINDAESWSGYHALRAHLAQSGRLEAFFRSVTVTGSHDASIDRVLAGDADCAAIDSSIWADRVRSDPRLHELRVVTQTDDRPAPPFAVARSLDPMLRAAIAAALTRTTPAGLAGIASASDADYDAIRHGMALAERVAW